jgi:hypothetical protein
VNAPMPGQPPVELRSSPAAPCHRLVPSDGGLAQELAQLAGLLAELVVLTGDNTVFPSRGALIAELALEQDSVRAALHTEGTGSPSRGAGTPPLSTAHIVDQLEQLRELAPDRAGAGDG